MKRQTVFKLAAQLLDSEFKIDGFHYPTETPYAIILQEHFRDIFIAVFAVAQFAHLKDQVSNFKTKLALTGDEEKIFDQLYPKLPTLAVVNTKIPGLQAQLSTMVQNYAPKITQPNERNKLTRILQTLLTAATVPGDLPALVIDRDGIDPNLLSALWALPIIQITIAAIIDSNFHAEEYRALSQTLKSRSLPQTPEIIARQMSGVLLPEGKELPLLKLIFSKDIQTFFMPRSFTCIEDEHIPSIQQVTDALLASLTAAAQAPADGKEVAAGDDASISPFQAGAHAYRSRIKTFLSDLRLMTEEILPTCISPQEIADKMQRLLFRDQRPLWEFISLTNIFTAALQRGILAAAAATDSVPAAPTLAASSSGSDSKRVPQSMQSLSSPAMQSSSSPAFQDSSSLSLTLAAPALSSSSLSSNPVDAQSLVANPSSADSPTRPSTNPAAVSPLSSSTPSSPAAVTPRPGVPRVSHARGNSVSLLQTMFSSIPLPTPGGTPGAGGKTEEERKREKEEKNQRNRDDAAERAANEHSRRSSVLRSPTTATPATISPGEGPISDTSSNSLASASSNPFGSFSNPTLSRPSLTNQRKPRTQRMIFTATPTAQSSDGNNQATPKG